MSVKTTCLLGLLAVSIVAASALPGRATNPRADDAALLAARSKVHAGNCDLQPGTSAGFAIRRYEFSGKRLVEIPCRLTIRSVMSVFFTEDAGGLHPLFFASALLDYRQDANGRIDWKKARIAGFQAVGELPNPHVDTDAGVIYASFRLPPGVADGSVLSVYRLDDGALIRVEVSIAGSKKAVRAFVWSSPKP